VDIEAVSSRVPYRSNANILEGEVMVLWCYTARMGIGGGPLWWEGGEIEELEGMSQSYMIL